MLLLGVWGTVTDYNINYENDFLHLHSIPFEVYDVKRV